MIEAFNTWLKVPADKLEIIGRVVNMLHSASLLYVLSLMPRHPIVEQSAVLMISRMTHNYDAAPLV